MQGTLIQFGCATISVCEGIVKGKHLDEDCQARKLVGIDTGSLRGVALRRTQVHRIENVNEKVEDVLYTSAERWETQP